MQLQNEESNKSSQCMKPWGPDKSQMKWKEFVCTEFPFVSYRAVWLLYQSGALLIHFFVMIYLVLAGILKFVV